MKGKEEIMTDRLRHECISCLMKNLDKVPAEATDDKRLEYMQRVLRIFADADKSSSGPVMVRQIYDIQKEMFGMENDFTDIKKYFNNLILEKEKDIRNNINKATDPLKLAVQYAMIGNYIDFGAMNTVDEAKLNELIDNANADEVADEPYKELVSDISTAKKIVYLPDNCGEIVFDKVFISKIKEQYPDAQITVLVKGGAILNDATMEDAVQVGLDKIVTVMGNGNNIAGTCLEKLSKEAKVVIDDADVIISKGQANYETLRKCGMNVYYIFMCKCDMFAKGFNVPRYTGMLVRDKNCV